MIKEATTATVPRPTLSMAATKRISEHNEKMKRNRLPGPRPGPPLSGPLPPPPPPRTSSTKSQSVPPGTPSTRPVTPCPTPRPQSDPDTHPALVGLEDPLAENEQELSSSYEEVHRESIEVSIS